MNKALLKVLGSSLILCTLSLPSTSSELSHSFKNPSFSGNGYSTHVLSLEQLRYSREKNITDDAKSWMEVGTEVFGVLAAKDIQQLLGETTTISTEGFTGLKAGREGYPEYTETPTQAYVRNVIEQNPTDITGDEETTADNVNALLESMGISSKYRADWFYDAKDYVEILNNDDEVVAKINLKNKNAYKSFLNTIAELGAKEVDARGENELLLETRSYRKKKSKKKTSAPKKEVEKGRAGNF